MSTFDEAWARTIGLEGGYSDNANDAGGPTQFGITQVVARANGYTGPMKDLTLATAKAIAKSAYWDLYNMDAIAFHAPLLAQLMFDISYNGGYPGKWLQRALNAMSRPAPLIVDGVIGGLSVAVLGNFMSLRGKDAEIVLMRLLYCQRGVYFLELAEASGPDATFIYGWADGRLGPLPQSTTT